MTNRTALIRPIEKGLVEMDVITVSENADIASPARWITPMILRPGVLVEPP